MFISPSSYRQFCMAQVFCLALLFYHLLSCLSPSLQLLPFSFFPPLSNTTSLGCASLSLSSLTEIQFFLLLSQMKSAIHLFIHQLPHLEIQPIHLHKNDQWKFLKKTKIELPYDPATPLLGIYPEKTIIQKESCTKMFIAALIYNSQDMEAT